MIFGAERTKTLLFFTLVWKVDKHFRFLLLPTAPSDQFSPGFFSSLQVSIFSSIFHPEVRSEHRDRPSTRQATTGPMTILDTISLRRTKTGGFIVLRSRRSKTGGFFVLRVRRTKMGRFFVHQVPRTRMGREFFILRSRVEASSKMGEGLRVFFEDGSFFFVLSASKNEEPVSHFYLFSRKNEEPSDSSFSDTPPTKLHQIFAALLKCGSFPDLPCMERVHRDK